MFSPNGIEQHWKEPKTTEVWFREGSYNKMMSTPGLAVPFLERHYQGGFDVRTQCRFAIKSSTTFTIVTKVSEDVLGKTEKITLKYSK